MENTGKTGGNHAETTQHLFTAEIHSLVLYSFRKPLINSTNISSRPWRGEFSWADGIDKNIEWLLFYQNIKQLIKGLCKPFSFLFFIVIFKSISLIPTISSRNAILNYVVIFSFFSWMKGSCSSFFFQRVFLRANLGNLILYSLRRFFTTQMRRSWVNDICFDFVTGQNHLLYSFKVVSLDESYLNVS